MRKTAETQAELDVITNDTEKLQYFYKLIAEFDKDEKNNNHKHFRSEYRCNFDIANMDNKYDPNNLNTYIPKKLLKLCNPKNWDEIIFSDNEENLYQHMPNKLLNDILKRQTKAQKEVFFYRVIKGYTAEEISKIRGISDRCVRKLYENALHNIRKELYTIIKFKQKLVNSDKYKDIVKERNISVNAYEIRFLENFKDVFQEEYENIRKKP